MKKEYNRETMSDMSVDTSFTPSVTETTTKKTSTKPKISAIGTQKRTTGTKTSSSKSTSSKSGTSKSTSSKTSSSKTSSTKTSSAKSKTSTTKKGVEQEDIVESKAKSKKIKTQLVNSEEEISDLEKINEQNIKSYRFKSKRSKVIIAILSVLLAITIATIVTFAVISRLKTNCNFYADGDASVTFIIDGKEMDEFRSPSNLQGNRVFQIDVEVKIKSSGLYNIQFYPECYQKGVLMNNTLIYEHNTDLFYESSNGRYNSISPIEGEQTIRLCGGIILDYEYEDSLNVDNFRLDFYVVFEKV